MNIPVHSQNMVLARFVRCSTSLTKAFVYQPCLSKMSSETPKKNNIQFERFGDRLEKMRERTAVKTEFCPPNYVSALVPTLHTDSFDTKGRKIHPWVLLKVFDQLDMAWPQYRQAPNPDTPVSGVYILKLQVDIAPELYHMDSQMHPLLVEGKMLVLKRSSRVYENTVRHPNSKKPYATFKVLDVNVNLETRRPFPFPDCWRHDSIPAEGAVIDYDVPNESSTIIMRKRQVFQSDIDENGHMNYTSYVRFCHDVFVDNVTEGKYLQNAADNLEAGVKQMQLVFKNECLRGDTLNIESWEDTKENSCYHFKMSKNGELVVAATFRFFNSEQTKKSKI